MRTLLIILLLFAGCKKSTDVLSAETETIFIYNGPDDNNKYRFNQVDSAAGIPYKVIFQSDRGGFGLNVWGKSEEGLIVKIVETPGNGAIPVYNNTKEIELKDMIWFKDFNVETNAYPGRDAIVTIKLWQ